MTDHYYPQAQVSLRNRAFDNAYIKFLEAHKRTYYNYLYSQKRYDEITDDPVVHELFQQLEQMKRPGHVEGYWKITLNPPEQDESIPNTWQSLRQVIKKILAYKNFLGDEYAYVLEQRSGDVNYPHGYHAHLMVEVGPKSKSEVIKRCANAMKSKFKCDVNSVHVGKCDIGYFEYLKGEKKPTEKCVKVDVDRQLRETFGFKQLYGGFSCTCESPVPKRKKV